MPLPTLDLEDDEFQSTVERMKREIITDIENGVFSKDVASFSDMHDFVDANEYGGFCETEVIRKIEQRYAMHVNPHSLNCMKSDKNTITQWNESRKDTIDHWNSMIHYINAAQNTVDQWIRAGGLKDVIVKPSPKI